MSCSLKWWHFSQNNSGGYFIKNDKVTEDVLIQAFSAKDAESIAERLFEDFSEYCNCCGERWNTSTYEEDGECSPKIYEQDVFSLKKSMFRTECILHHYNGDVVKIIYPET